MFVSLFGLLLWLALFGLLRTVLWLVADCSLACCGLCDCAECHGSQGCPADAVAAMVQGCEMTGCTAAQVRLRVREGMGSVCVCVLGVCVEGGVERTTHDRAVRPD